MMEVVETCCKNQELIIMKYDKNDEDLFLYGYIKQYNAKEIIMKCVNERGQYDGYAAILMVSDIWRVNYGGKKTERIRLLYESQKYAGRDIQYKNSRLLYDMLEFAKARELIITVFTMDTEIEGYVKKYDEKTIHIKKIDEFGLEEGCSVTDLDKILYLFADTREGRNRDMLYRETYNHKASNSSKHKGMAKRSEKSNVNELMHMINYCCSHNLVTSIFDYDSDQSEDGNWTGSIDDFNNKEIMFRQCKSEICCLKKKENNTVDIFIEICKKE